VAAQPVLTATPLAGSAEGAGELLVVLASLGGSHEDWRAAAELLADRWQVVGIDHPGHGASALAEDPFAIEDLAAGVLDAVDALGHERFAIAGLSLGGAVAQELAITWPQRLSGVAVLCSAPRIGEPSGWRDRAVVVRRSGTGSLVGGLAERWFTPAFTAADPDTVGRVLAGVAATDDESYALCCEALGGWDVRDRIAGLTVPVLAVRGEHDPVATAEAMRPLVQAPGVTSVVLPGVRHQAAVEAPDAVAAALLAGL
jgi:3-oxoadipate enol-lactonase/4-carboxymuconolactone decarboxylase